MSHTIRFVRRHHACPTTVPLKNRTLLVIDRPDNLACPPVAWTLAAPLPLFNQPLSTMMLAAAARTVRKASLLLPCPCRFSPNNNSRVIQVRWMHPEQRLIEKRQIALAKAHQQVAELEAKQAAEQAEVTLLQVTEARMTRSTHPVSSALPKPKTNDGTSSGAVAERRLREKRQAILEKMMQESSSNE